VFATIMIIFIGLLGLCMLIGGRHFGEQSFGHRGASASLATLAAIASLTLVFPNYTTTMIGPFYSSSQLGFVAAVSAILYARRDVGGPGGACDRSKKPGSIH